MERSTDSLTEHVIDESPYPSPPPALSATMPLPQHEPQPSEPQHHASRQHPDSLTAAQTPTASRWVRRSDRGSPIEEPLLEVGVKVFAADPSTVTWKGQWYAGVITALNECGYSVAFEDGDKRDLVSRCHITTSNKRPPALPPATSRKRPRAQEAIEAAALYQSEEEVRQRKLLGSRGKNAEVLRQGSGMLTRELLDAGAAGSLYEDEIRYKRWIHRAHSLYLQCKPDPTLCSSNTSSFTSLASTATASRKPEVSRQRTTAVLDEQASGVIAAAIAVCCACHGWAVVCRTKLPALPSPSQLRHFESVILEQHSSQAQQQASQSLLELHSCMVAAQPPSATATQPTLSPISGSSVESLLKLAIGLKDALLLTKGMLTDPDFACALNSLVENPSVPPLRHLAVSLLHLLSRLKPTAFSADWIPCAERGVFWVGASLKDVWLAKGELWKLPFLSCSTELQLETCVYELIRSLKPEQLRCSSVGLQMLNATENWERRRVRGCRSRQKAPRMSWENANVDSEACTWLDNVCKAGNTRLASGRKSLAPLKGLWSESQLSAKLTVEPGGVVVVLGGGHNPLASVLHNAGLLRREVFSGYMLFETSDACLSLAAHHWPAPDGLDLEVPEAFKHNSAGDVLQLSDPDRLSELLRGRWVAFILNTPSCKGHARVVKGRQDAGMEEVDLFLNAEKALSEHNQRIGKPAPDVIFECGDMPQHLITAVEERTERKLFNLNASELSGLQRNRTFATTYPIRPIAEHTGRGLDMSTVLNQYLSAHGSQCLAPEWVEGFQLCGGRQKGRTPRAEKPPPRKMDRSPAAMLAASHGGINLVSSSAGGQPTHCLGIKATSVLMGYSHVHFTDAAGVANAPTESWRVLGNTIHKQVLELLTAPWIKALHERTRQRYAQASRDPKRRQPTGQQNFCSEREARLLPIGKRLVVADDNRQWSHAKVVAHSESALTIEWCGARWVGMTFEIDYRDASYTLSKCDTPKLANNAATKLSQHMFGCVV